MCAALHSFNAYIPTVPKKFIFRIEKCLNTKAGETIGEIYLDHTLNPILLSDYIVFSYLLSN